MALPAHLAKYDALIDVLVGALVREAQDGADLETPAGIEHAEVESKREFVKSRQASICSGDDAK